MKIAILGDLHWGIRGGHPVFFIHYKNVFSVILDYLNEHKISTVFQLGDCFDNRKHIQLRTLKEAKEILFDPLFQYNIQTHILIGNHDSHFKSNIDINSPELILKEYPNVYIYSSPTTLNVDNTVIDIIPWICDDNQTEILNYIKQSKADLCFGHFELKSFEMYKGMVSHEGLEPEMLSKYELVCSGHFHTKSYRDNIVYTGTNCQMTWQDFNDVKGFHVFDTVTRILTFVPIKYDIFIKIEYNQECLLNLENLDLEHKFVKIVVIDKGDLYKFDYFLNTIYKKNPYEVKIIEDMSLSDAGLYTDIKIEDTMDVVGHYIDQISLMVDQEKLKDLMSSLYTEALNVGIL